MTTTNECGAKSLAVGDSSDGTTVNVELMCRLLKDHAPPHEATVSQELDGGTKLEWITFKWSDQVDEFRPVIERD